MHLFDIQQEINITKTYNLKKNKYFSHITSNSKLTNTHTIFIFDKDSKANIHHIKEAIKNKVPAIISNKYHKFINIPQFIVPNINLETEVLLKIIYKFLPSNSIAITGTNGKTSVVWYISKILTLLNYNNVTVGTIGHYINGKKIQSSTLTTPAYEELYKYGSSIKKNDYTYIFEASSHALQQNRLKNYPVNIAAITNISNDHLDYHKNIYEYKKAKIKLFTKHLNYNGCAIINSRIKNLSFFKKNLLNKNFKKVFFGKNLFLKSNKNSTFLYINKKKYLISKLKLSADFELENLECAISCCLALNIKKEKILNVLNRLTNPPGRSQKINFKKKKATIIIDYAHTGDALKKILQSFYKNNKKPILLFGCGGDRDKNKRKIMGLIANKYASKVYITDDNPRNESPSKIRNDILKYCPSGIEIAGRKNAIKKAIKKLENNDILIIAGKGHEKVQIIKKKKLKFDDYNVAKSFIEL